MNNALVENSPTAKRLIPALSFFNLANTDSDVMEQEVEVMLMASAFEQLLGFDGAWDFSKSVGALMQPYAGETTVEQAKLSRQGIEIDPKYQAAQNAWPLHRKWAEEFYHLRNKYSHGEDRNRTWGWSPLEHLVMAAFVFPLTVKLLLASEGHYAMVDKDHAKLRAVDKLLAANGWGKRVPDENVTVWHEIMLDAMQDVILERAICEAREEAKKRTEDSP